MQEDEPEIATDEEEEEEEEDDDGPPPGFQCIIAPPPPPPEKVEAGGGDDDDDDYDDDDDDDYDDDDEEEEGEEEEGPPPGFHFVSPKPPPLVSPSEMSRSIKQEIFEDDEDGPPPGWEFSALENALPKTPPNGTDISDIKMESHEELDEGPPPGWETVLPHQMPSPHTPPLQPSLSILPNIEMESEQNTARDDDVPPSVSKSKNSSPARPPLQPPPPSELLPCDKGIKEDDKKSGGSVDKKPTSENKPLSPLQQLLSTPPKPAPAAPSSSEKAQLVCGTCRKLCVYPRGAKWVQCPECREVNFVLEAHEVGQVKCGGCAVLLMYPHGAPAVQCSSCRFVTEIGAHNRRPPLSVQQAQRRRRSNRAR